MVRPIDESAFDLATEMLVHRYETVKADRMSHIKERIVALEKLQRDRTVLQQVFENHKRHWVAWTFPIQNGRHLADDDTPVPPVDATYDPILDRESIHRKQSEGQDVANVSGVAAQKVWDSFVSTMHVLQYGTDTAAHTHAPKGRRLSIFERLNRGEHISPNRNLPHILNTRVVVRHNSSVRPKESYLKQSERCWRSILLTDQHETGSDSCAKDWGEIMEHFENAKSKKVLGFVQS